MSETVTPTTWSGLVPILRPKFAGLSVVDARCSLGWGSEQTSELRLSLVRDESDGDFPAPAPLGSPVYFACGGLVFGGLLQRFVERRSRDGYPVWEATCIDPREILRNVEVVISGWSGSVATVPNVVNAYGWWETNSGYGNSLANDSGMPWNRVLIAVNAICNSGVSGIFGGPPRHLGPTRYGLDLTRLPVPDAGYRIGGGVSVNLMEAIARVCEDGGCDFFVELVGTVIRVRTVSRRNPPPLGTIRNLIASGTVSTGRVLRSEDGMEVRNETTSAFLVGGEVCELLMVDSTDAVSFWGYDVNGEAIVGVPGIFQLKSVTENPVLYPPVVLAEVPCEFMALNATGVADVLGSVSYPCSTLEMRLALAGYESWSVFIEHHRPEVRGKIYSPFRNRGGQQAMRLRPDVVDDELAAVRVGMAGINSDFHAKAQRLFEFVRGYATEFYGRKFLVGLPAISARQDPESLRWSFSMEPVEGGWLPEDAAPLGLSPLDRDVFRISDGRYGPFVAWSPTTGADLTRVAAADSVVSAGTLWLRSRIEPGMVFLTRSGVRIAAALVSLGSAVHDQAVQTAGDNTIMAAVLGMTENQAAPILNRLFGPTGVRIHPAARTPTAFAVPLRNNTVTYGPWWIAGVPGRVRFESDPSLVPWNYGGFTEMNLAASSRVLNSVTNMRVSESGSLEIEGFPAISPGDALVAGGPEATGVDLSFGPQGITTSYRFQSFTPRFGVFSKPLAERIKRLGLTGMELRKALRTSAGKSALTSQTVNDAFRGFLANAPRAVVPKTPHEILVGHVAPVRDQEGNVQAVRTATLQATYEEAVSLVRGDDSAEYRTKACVSADGLFRPYTTRPNDSVSSFLPAFVPPNAGALGVTSESLNPWRSGHDVSWSASGRTYSRLNSWENGGDPADTRAVGLKGPVVVVGWGWDTDGKPVPSGGTPGSWHPQALRRSDLWKAGPVDLLWDEHRGVWTAHDLVSGTVPSGVPAGGEGPMLVSGYTGRVLTVKNRFSTPVGSGVAAMAGWFAAEHCWYVFAADCTS